MLPRGQCRQEGDAAKRAMPPRGRRCQEGKAPRGRLKPCGYVPRFRGLCRACSSWSCRGSLRRTATKVPLRPHEQGRGSSLLLGGSLSGGFPSKQHSTTTTANGQQLVRNYLARDCVLRHGAAIPRAYYVWPTRPRLIDRCPEDGDRH